MVALTPETIDLLPINPDMKGFVEQMEKLRGDLMAVMALPSELLNPNNIAPSKWKRPMPDVYDENPNTRNAGAFLTALAAKVAAGELVIGDFTVDRSRNDPCRMNIAIKVVRGTAGEVELPATGEFAPKAAQTPQRPLQTRQPTQLERQRQIKQRALQWQRGGPPADYVALDKYGQPEPVFEGGYSDLPSPNDGYMEEEEQELIGAPSRQKPPEGTRDLDLDI
jgi:hypothetical protein